MFEFENYHIHSSDSNIFVPDSAMTKADYAKRAVELGHKTLSSCEHGYQGRYYDVYDIAKKYGLKFRFGCEAYWVKDRHTQDRANNHICIFARNENGRKAINRILSEANIDGYYYRPRLDLELIFSLPPNDVFLTSACVAFFFKTEKVKLDGIAIEKTEQDENESVDFPETKADVVKFEKRIVQKYDDIDDIVLRLHNHFRDNFCLEVQYHHTELQNVLNTKVRALATKYNIQMIMGCDSHYIYPHQAEEREIVLQAKGVHYDEEDGWFMDYPDGDTAYHRFVEQGILNDDEIRSAIRNTLVFREFEDIEFDKNIKLPTLYPNMTQKEKNSLYKKIIMKEWDVFKEEVPKELHQHYRNEIRDEVRCVCNTKMADYFLIDYEIVKEAVKNGGVITASGRGSASSFYTNTLLGFSKVDRISAPVKLYAERFISETRIIETKSLPDIDMNVSDPSIFAEAQRKILGDGHSYPMIAFGTFRKASAFKIYARAKKLPAIIQNEITSQIEAYEREVKYADDEDKDLIDIMDFIDEKYSTYYEESKKYLGLISDRKQHPCAYLLYSGNIKEEIGLILCKSESTGKEVITTVIDGGVAEKYKFLKNDLLKVDVVKLIDLIYKRVNVKPHTVIELLKAIKDDDALWSVYAKGLTMGINQVEKYSTTKKVMKYKPKNISEITAFIAAIRPSFKSMYYTFEGREPFSYGIPSFDKLIQTEEVPNSYVLYQEQMMATLAYAGFDRNETYSIIKAIAKKKPDVVKPLKERFVTGFSGKIIEGDNTTTQERAVEMSETVWQIIDDSAGYGFNASHAYCVALDSVYGAYLKAHYPLEFYEVMLQYYSDKKDKEKVALFKQEMTRGFGIEIGDIRFGNDNRKFVSEPENNRINQSILSIKFLNQTVSDELYELGQNKPSDFIGLLKSLDSLSINSRQLDILIRLNYFEEYGRNQKLTNIVELYRKFGSSKSIKKEVIGKINIHESIIYQCSEETEKTYKNIDNLKMMRLIWDTVENKSIKLIEQVAYEIDYLEYVVTTIPSMKEDYCVVLEIEFSSYDKFKSKPYLMLYHLKDGSIQRVRIVDEKLFGNQRMKEKDIICVRKIKEEPKYVKNELGKRVKSDVDFNFILEDWINISTDQKEGKK